MPAVSRRPSAPLQPFVRLVWCSDTPAGGGLERVLPTGSMHVVIRLNDTPLRLVTEDGPIVVGTSVVGGARSSSYVKDVTAPARSVGAWLHADAALPLLGLPAGDVAEQHVSLEDVWGSSAAVLRERLLESRSAAEALDHFERELARRLPAVRGVHPLVAHALARLREDVPVGQVVEESGYSHRTVASVFREAVGLTPKVWCRVQRFQRAITAIASGRALGSVAAEAGYADQAHLTREFVEIAGLTPSAYRAAAPERANHVPASDTFKTPPGPRRRLGP
jgi:AraC-like DNA-binding protein